MKTMLQNKKKKEKKKQQKKKNEYLSLSIRSYIKQNKK
jgi:hypothetical protein